MSFACLSWSSALPVTPVGGGNVKPVFTPGAVPGGCEKPGTVPGPGVDVGIANGGSDVRTDASSAKGVWFGRAIGGVLVAGGGCGGGMASS